MSRSSRRINTMCVVLFSRTDLPYRSMCFVALFVLKLSLHNSRFLQIALIHEAGLDGVRELHSILNSDDFKTRGQHKSPWHHSGAFFSRCLFPNCFCSRTRWRQGLLLRQRTQQPHVDGRGAMKCFNHTVSQHNKHRAPLL